MLTQENWINVTTQPDGTVVEYQNEINDPKICQNSFLHHFFTNIRSIKNKIHKNNEMKNFCPGH